MIRALSGGAGGGGAGEVRPAAAAAGSGTSHGAEAVWHLALQLKIQKSASFLFQTVFIITALES